MADLSKSIPSDFITLDIADDQESPTSNSTPRLKKGFSRKGSQKIGMDIKKLVAVEANAATIPINVGGGQGHVAGCDESASLSHVSTHTAGGGKVMRRLGSSRRAPSSWIDPRRVLFVFATLSSMGTLILLYFTLSMAKTNDGDVDIQ